MVFWFACLFWIPLSPTLSSDVVHPSIFFFHFYRPESPQVHLPDSHNSQRCFFFLSPPSSPFFPLGLSPWNTCPVGRFFSSFAVFPPFGLPLFESVYTFYRMGQAAVLWSCLVSHPSGTKGLSLSSPVSALFLNLEMVPIPTSRPSLSSPRQSVSFQVFPPSGFTSPVWSGMSLSPAMSSRFFPAYGIGETVPRRFSTAFYFSSFLFLRFPRCLARPLFLLYLFQVFQF